MKKLLPILILSLIVFDASIAQTDSVKFKKVETGNWLDLTFQALNESGDEIAYFFN